MVNDETKMAIRVSCGEFFDGLERGVANKVDNFAERMLRKAYRDATGVEGRLDRKREASIVWAIEGYEIRLDATFDDITQAVSAVLYSPQLPEESKAELPTIEPEEIIGFEDVLVAWAEPEVIRIGRELRSCEKSPQ